ncbi:acetyl-CoA carboxylase biotin carboxylase subunit [Roseibium aggregatum]|uniref:biotin carboxylase n=1 Tax=Roseibium aggregatum TaxID=187304 RepID=A0A926P2Q5_9HYPH|nr:acetyl-CoA carboxylase biotin carboxylase subunit [Roseibium aggregatum]MBD1548480.1 acetyl-CoA carboxylase biotin carboxylase subunit [Roseibium aggregatum]
MDLSGRKLFIANRGEIAVRINRAAKSLGMTVAQGYSEADGDMLAVRLADQAVEIGPPHATKSYLDIVRVVEAAKSAGADAVHPGYGFLSENAEFAAAVEAAGMIFVGPSAETIARMGDKAKAREAAEAAGVPIAPGSDGRVETVEDAIEAAKGIGYPLMIKAAAGGGGRGIRVADNDDDLKRLVPQARSEAEAAFGDGGLYLERMIAHARHVEVQILGDGQSAVHLFERECSLQRRRQKVWEEAPAACLPQATRERICAVSVRLAEAVGYRGAGTLEYLYDPERDAFYFMEMNTRIQVEHPVTEMVTGADLVAEMIRIAFGEPLRFEQSGIALSGHAIEVRVNAEDPASNFMPFPGVAQKMRVPENVRFDTMLYEGYAIPPFYDSLIGKLIVHGSSREEALQKLREALAEMEIEGLKTTLPLYRALADDPDVQADNTTTKFLEAWLETNAIKAA